MLDCIWYATSKRSQREYSSFIQIVYGVCITSATNNENEHGFGTYNIPLAKEVWWRTPG
jgi:hypothetical protein